MNFLFLFASLGVINGTLVSAYLLFRKERKLSDIYFAGMILMLCIRIGKSIHYRFFPETDKLILQLGLSACIFIGPFFYLYVKTLKNRQSQYQVKDVVLLAFLLTTIAIIGFIFPYRTNPEIWNTLIVQGIYLVWATFTLLALHQAYFLLKRSTWKSAKEKQYFIVILVGIVFITLTYQLALHIGFTYMWGSFIFSILFYVLAFRAIASGKSITPKTPTNKLIDGDSMLQQINDLMDAEKLYRKQDLKLEDIASQTGLTRHEVSQVLNETYSHGYTHYIKELRINEAKELIATRPDLSLEGIGYEAGFKSKSVFFEAFRKLVGSTPASYKKQLEEQNQ